MDAHFNTFGTLLLGERAGRRLASEETLGAGHRCIDRWCRRCTVENVELGSDVLVRQVVVDVAGGCRPQHLVISLAAQEEASYPRRSALSSPRIVVGGGAMAGVRFPVALCQGAAGTWHGNRTVQESLPVAAAILGRETGGVHVRVRATRSVRTDSHASRRRSWAACRRRPYPERRTCRRTH